MTTVPTPRIVLPGDPLVEGETAVIRPGPDGNFAVAGRITVDKWAERFRNP